MRDAMSPPTPRPLPEASHSRSLVASMLREAPSIRSSQLSFVISVARISEEIEVPSRTLSNTITGEELPTRIEVIFF